MPPKPAKQGSPQKIAAKSTAALLQGHPEALMGRDRVETLIEAGRAVLQIVSAHEAHDTDLERARQDTLYMNPSTMRHLNLCLDQRVLLAHVGGGGILAVAHVWPAKTLHPRHAGVFRVFREALGKGLGEGVEVVPYLACPAVAALVRLCVAGADEQHLADGMFIDYVRARTVGCIVRVGRPLPFAYLGCPVILRVVSVALAGSEDGGSDARDSFCLVTSQTAVHVAASSSCMPERSSLPANTEVTFASIGGLASQLATIREVVELPLKSPQLFRDFGLRPPRGILLVGPPGTGKTLIARAVANSCGAHVTCINGPEVMSKFYGETEKRLKAIFDTARTNSPALIFIDEIDALCPSRDTSLNELEKRIVSTLLTLMDGAGPADPAKHVLVIGATNRADALDTALRRPGRFDVELEIGIPTAADRLDILHVLLRNVPNTLRVGELEKIAASAHGYVGADLAAVCKEAGFAALKRTVAGGYDAATAAVSGADMAAALGAVRPSAMREVLIEIPRVRWTDIGGQEHTKQRLREAVEWPIKHPEVFERMGIRPPRGVLLYGPPGCSKTLMAKALATESGLNFIAVKGPELFSKWVGESERAVSAVFRKARMASPSIVFFDEIDALAVARAEEGGGVADRVLSQLLTEMDGVQGLQNVTVVAATNRPDMLDAALLRPGRIDRMIYVGPPDLPARCDIFARALCTIPHNPSDLQPAVLALETDGFSGAECVGVCREACLQAMCIDPANASEVTLDNFRVAIRKTTRAITDEMLSFYESFRKDHEKY